MALDAIGAKDDAPHEGNWSGPEGDMATVCDCKRLTICGAVFYA